MTADRGEGASQPPPPEGRLVLSFDDLAEEPAAVLPSEAEVPTRQIPQPPLAALAPAGPTPLVPPQATPGPSGAILSRYSSGVIGIFGAVFIWLMSLAAVALEVAEILNSRVEFGPALAILLASTVAMAAFVSFFIRSFSLDLAVLLAAGWLIRLGGSDGGLITNPLLFMFFGSVLLLVGVCRGILRPLHDDKPEVAGGIPRAVLAVALLLTSFWFLAEILVQEDSLYGGGRNSIYFFYSAATPMNLAGMSAALVLAGLLVLTFRKGRFRSDTALLWGTSWLIPLFGVSMLEVFAGLGDLSDNSDGEILVGLLYLLAVVLLVAGSIVMWLSVSRRFREASFASFGSAQMSSPFIPAPYRPVQAQAPPGWQSDPHNPDQYRWWDGQSWTDQYAPKPGSR